MYLHVILYYVSCCQKLAFTVSTLLSWKLHWDPSDLGRVARDLFTKRFTIRPMWNLQKILRYFFLLLLVCQMWTEQDSAEMIQDSPSQCQHILYFIKDKTLLLIGSNDQTHLIDPNSLSDMNYHDCFDSFVCFFVTGYHHLQSPEALPTASSSSSRSGLQTLVPQPTFSSCKGWSVLRRSLILKPWQGCCFSTEKQYIHSPSMTTLQQLSFKSEKLKPKIMPHS